MHDDDVTCRPTEFVGCGGIRLIGDHWRPADVPARPPSLVFLHGGGQTRHSWDKTARRMATLGWEAVTVDSRGHGQSDWAPADGYALTDSVADLHAVIDSLRHPPVVIGASAGGRAALVAEGERPGHTAGLVLVDIAPRLDPQGSARIKAFMTGAPHGFATLDDVAEAVHAYNPDRPRPRNLRGLTKNVRRRDDGRWYWHWDPEFLKAFESWDHDGVRARSLKAARNITTPTLLVRGATSDMVSRDAVEELLRLIRSAQSVEVSAGHMIAGLDNDVFAAHLTGFLDSDVIAHEIRSWPV